MVAPQVQSVTSSGWYHGWSSDTAGFRLSRLLLCGVSLLPHACPCPCADCAAEGPGCPQCFMRKTLKARYRCTRRLLLDCGEDYHAVCGSPSWSQHSPWLGCSGNPVTACPSWGFEKRWVKWMGVALTLLGILQSIISLTVIQLPPQHTPLMDTEPHVSWDLSWACLWHYLDQAHSVRIVAWRSCLFRRMGNFHSLHKRPCNVLMPCHVLASWPRAQGSLPGLTAVYSRTHSFESFSAQFGQHLLSEVLAGHPC